MAGGGMVTTGEVKHFEGKATVYVVLTCILAACGGLMFGYDVGISGGVTSMNDFLAKFFPNVLANKLRSANTGNTYCQYNDQKLQAFTSSLYLAGLVSTFFAAPVTRRYGRKPTMLIAGLCFCAGVVFNAAAQDLAMLIIGRVLLGWGVGFANQAVPLYLSEMAPTRWRGGLNILFQLAVTIGILFANLVNYGTGKMKHDGWRVSLGLAGIPAGLLTLGGILLPETPNSLVQRGKLEQGRKVLRKIRGIENVDAEFEDLILAAEESKRIINPFRNLMLRRNRPQLVIAFIMQFFQQFTGINAIMFYAPVLFQTLGFQSDASLYSAVITGAVNVVSTVVAIVVVDRAGRRILLLEAGVQMFISQTAIAIILAVGMKNGVSLSHTLGVIVVVLICVYVSSFAWSWGPLGWLIPSEIFPLEARSAGQSVTVSSNLFFTFVIAQAFLSMLCAFKWGIFLFFAGWVIIMQIFVILFLPETKGIPIEEMEVVWTKHWFWKRFVPDAPIVDHAGIPTIDDTKKSNNLKPATTNGADNGYHNNHNAGQQA
jgi:sugar porter (SP) family MFS transporter